MASFFGELATEVGGALQENAENLREERLQGEDHLRDMQLAKQRMTHDTKTTQMRIDADDKRETRRQEYQTTLAEQEQTFLGEQAETKREADETKYKYEGEVDLQTAALNAWTQRQRDGVGRGNGWTTFTEQEQDLETGAIVPAFYAQRDGITYRQIGDKYIEAGSQRQPAQFESIDVQREAEQKLWSGEVNAQQFKDVFGYVPAAYITGQVAQGSSLGQFMRQNGLNFNRGGGGGGESREITPLSGEIDAIVDQSAAQYGVPKNLILSVMDVESGGESDRANATSTAGARGHMQLMPGTFEEMGGTDITAPGQNIPAGTAYLAKMMERYGGNVAHALAAYNAGPKRTDTALKSGADWISKLPPETRAYLPKALGRYYSLTQQQGGAKEPDAPITSGGALSEGAAIDATSQPADPAVASETAQAEGEQSALEGMTEPDVGTDPVNNPITESAPTELPPRPDVIDERNEGFWGGPTEASTAASKERRGQIRELTDEDISDMISNITQGMQGIRGGQPGSRSDLGMLESEQRRRERDARVMPHDYLFGTEKGEAARARNLATAEATMERARKAREAETAEAE